MTRSRRIDIPNPSVLCSDLEQERDPTVRLRLILRNRNRCVPNSFGHANDVVMMESLTNAFLS
ncbi:MAG: hypothetical protein ACLFS2_10820 [Halochromatium sp.]|uniref:hypothetical protein n=1 Tax=Halochromatium sp. TaxID=2049430 RepID=UPI00397D0338